MAPAQCPRQVLIWTLPALAVLISFFWYKRKKTSLRSDPGGTAPEKPSERVDSHNLKLNCVTTVNSDKVIAAIEKAKRDLETSQAIEEVACIEDEEDESIAKKAQVLQGLTVEDFVQEVLSVEQDKSLVNGLTCENFVQDILEEEKNISLKPSSVPVSEKEIDSDTVKTPVEANCESYSVDLVCNSVDVVLKETLEKDKKISDCIVQNNPSIDDLSDQKINNIKTEVTKAPNSLEHISFIESSSDKEDIEIEKKVDSCSSQSPFKVTEKKDLVEDTVKEEACNKKVSSDALNEIKVIESPNTVNKINKVSGSKKRPNKRVVKENHSKTVRTDTKDIKKEDKLKNKKPILNSEISEENSNCQNLSTPIKSDCNKMELACSRVEQLGHNSSSSTINSNEAGLEQKLATLGLESSRNSEGGERDSANHSPAEVMLASPSMSNFSDAHSEGSSDSGKGCSDIPDISTPPPQTPAGGSSVAGDLIPSVYEFIIPQYMVGRLIGRHGVFLHDIRGKTHTHIFIKKHPDTTKLKICAIEGAPQDIDAALAMIRQKFPLRRFPNLTLEKVTFVNIQPSLCPLPQEHFQLQLIEGVNNDVILSSLISAGHFFLQQPMHPSYQSLCQLNLVMNTVYNSPEAPPLDTPFKDAICAAPAMGGWYRAQIIDLDDDNKTVDVRFLDYGGFLTLEASAIRKIRADFMMLPFQAVECLLANVIPAGGEDAEWTEEARLFVQDLTCGQILQAHISEYTETGIPLVYLYAMYCGQVVVVNQELVNRGYAEAFTPLAIEE